MFQIQNLTKKFKNGKGIFNVSFEIKKGEIFGFIGPNGAGKSTTIRHLMGFLKPDGGTAKIAGCNCWSESEKTKTKIGYLPGEIYFPPGMSASEFLIMQAGIRNIQDKIETEKLIARLDLNINIPIKNMSKGMKQKLAIVSAFMGNPEIIILDEPSTGLDPLMQKELIQLFKEKKDNGTTIFMSSHIFQEIEDVADIICIIKDGRIVENEKFSDIHTKLKPILLVTFEDKTHLTTINLPHLVLSESKISIEIDNNENDIIRQLSKCNIKNIDVKKVTLNDIFEKYYMQDNHSLN